MIGDIKRYTVQLFKDIEEDFTVVPLGTGVLCRFNGMYVLLTAGHVLSDDIESIRIMIDSTAYSLIGKGFVINPEVNLLNSQGDIGVFIFDSICVADLMNKYQFYELDTVLLKSVVKETGCFLYGFPASRTKVKFEDKSLLVSEPFIFETILEESDKKCSRLKLDLDINCMVNYHYKKLIDKNTGKKVKSPNPRGLSGSGLWTVINERPYLLAIMTNFNHKESVFWGVNIEEIITIIEHKYCK